MVIIDPGHFHASLIEKRLLPGVSDTVKVYAPEGQELDAYLEMVESFNERNDEPTSWYQDVHSGKDFLSQVPLAKKGDFVVLAGNNKRKTEYIFDAVSKGYNVLSDKPMAITPKGYSLLKEAYSQARKKKLILLDIMTERYDTLNALARKMISFDKVIGDTIESVSMVSVHHFYKKVTGSVLTRPAWYYPTIIAGIVLIVLAVIALLRMRAKNKKEQDERDKEILNTPLETFGDTETTQKAEELAKKYDSNIYNNDN